MQSLKYVSPGRSNVRTRLNQFGWLAAAVGPLAFVWIVSHPRELTFQPVPKPVPKIEGDPEVSSKPLLNPRQREPLAVTGQVVDGEGRPVRDVPVTLVDCDRRGDVLLPGRSREQNDRETRTDESGRFQLDESVFRM